jgi:TIR domain
MTRITISYRRDDSGAITGRIFDRLAAHYGREAIFRDIDNIPPGVDFRKHIDGILDESDVVLAIVGPRWIGPRGGQSRLTNAADPVRVEIETALQKHRPLIPVLVSRGSMPRVEQLPESLQDFAYHNAVSVDTGQDFDVHMARLIRAMDRMLDGTNAAAASDEGNDASPPLRYDALRPFGDDGSVLTQNLSPRLQPAASAELEALRDANRALEVQLAALTAGQHEEIVRSRDEGSAALLRFEQQVKDLTEQLAAAREAALALQGREENELTGARTKIQELTEQIAQLTRDLRAARAAGPSVARRHPAIVALSTAGALLGVAAIMIAFDLTEWHRAVQWLERVVLEARGWWR